MVTMSFIVCGAGYLTPIRNVSSGPVDVSISISYVGEETGAERTGVLLGFKMITKYVLILLTSLKGVVKHLLL